MTLRATSLAALGILLVTACNDQPVSPVTSLSSRASIESSDTGAEGNYLVRFKSNAIPSGFGASIGALGGEVIFAHDGVGVAAVSGLDESDAAAIAGMSGVAAVDADAYTTLEAPDAASVDGAESIPDSPSSPTLSSFYGRQWNMRAISAPAAWSAGVTGASTTRVGILDTGIDYLHPDLFGRVDLGASRSFLSAAENARVQSAFPGAHPIADLNYHGTHVSATVVSNAWLAAGVASKVTLVGLKVCTPGTAANGFRGSCPTSGTLSAILYAADIGLDVINMSLGGSFNRVDANAKGGFGPSFLATINQVMNYANRKGTAVVVSAGNSAWDMDHNGNGYASYCDAPAVICVSATGPTSAGFAGGWYVNVANIDALASYSNYGRSAVTVAAPGGNAIPVWAACSGFTIHPGLTSCRTRFYTSPTSWRGSVVGISGTSMAAPHVTGLAALIAGQVGHSPSQIAARLQQTADDLGQPGVDPAYGKGRINVARGTGL